MKFAIFGNTYQAKKSSHAKELFRLLEKHRAELYICRDFYHFLTNDLKLEIKDATLFDGDHFEADMVIRINSLMRKRLPFSLTAIDIQKVLLIMRGRCDSKGLAGGDCPCALLPTRQRNALRLLLDKRIFTPEEIAALDYHVVERAPFKLRWNSSCLGA